MYVCHNHVQMCAVLHKAFLLFLILLSATWQMIPPTLLSCPIYKLLISHFAVKIDRWHRKRKLWSCLLCFCLTSRLLLIFTQNPRTTGRLHSFNKESLVESLKIIFKDSDETHLGLAGSIGDWYLDALGKRFWSECVARILNLDTQFPIRPAKYVNIWPHKIDRKKRSSSQ